MNETLKNQINRLANFIMNECDGYPNASEGAVDCAIRIIKDHQEQIKSFLEISDEEIAKKFPDTIHDVHNCNINKQRGAKWYREQISKTK